MVECVSAAPVGCATAIEVHAGALEEGDVYEARLLAAAVEQRRAAEMAFRTPQRAELEGVRRESGGGLACSLTVHPGRDHNLVKEMRDLGELQALLQRVAGLAGGFSDNEGITDDFVGFRDCGDI